MQGRLGRHTPPDFEHVEKYPLSALGAAAPTNTPVVLGIPWMTNFDNPVKTTINGRSLYVIGQGRLGTERGGHAICSKPPAIADDTSWWTFYDQGETEECVGFSSARSQSLEKRVEFDAAWLYNAARAAEGNTSPEGGSTVRAAFSVLRKEGAKPARGKGPVSKDGISAYRWATTWDQVRATLGVPDDQDGIDLLQSWGPAYPHTVRFTDAAGEYCLANGGEAGLFTER